MCRISKLLSEYGNRTKGYFGKAARCKSCCVIVQSEYAKLNPDKVRLNQERCRLRAKLRIDAVGIERKQKIKQKAKIWYVENKDACLLHSKANYEKTKDRKLAKGREWYRKNISNVKVRGK